MAIDLRLVEQIDALSRADFRASVNAERRATLAIGALILHWGQLDSALGWMNKNLKERHVVLGFDGKPDENPIDHAGQLSLMRRLIRECSGCTGNHLRDFDRLRERIARATTIRDDLVHGALSLGNSSGKPDGVEIICMPWRKPKKTKDRLIPAGHEIVVHPLNEVFLAADNLWNDLKALENIISAVLEIGPPNG